MALVGYARVSTEDQATARQLDELRAAGCREVAEEHASGGDRDRPVLARTLARLRPGDTLVVVSLDRDGVPTNRSAISAGAGPSHQ